MSQRQVLFLRNGLVAGCAFAAIVLLASFYSIVSGAVDRAARHRLAIAESGTAMPAALLPQPTRRASLLVRSDN
jgi:hypothetical protein